MEMHTLPFADQTGFLTRLPNFRSRYVRSRHVDIWLPPGYAEQPAQRYPVLYMHDGQNLFDPALAFGGVDWGMDEAVQNWMLASGHPGVIVVGIWNTELRYREYMPQHPLTLHRLAKLRREWEEWRGGPVVADNYLRCIVEELKPLLDSRYRTLPDAPNTSTMGSSMGGLIALYALERYPEVFGSAGCISTHWPAGGDPLVDAMGEALPAPDGHRLYFDFGDQTLDEEYEPFQRRMDGWLQRAGYIAGQNWLTRKFAGAEHSEAAWRERVAQVLPFLFAQSELQV